MDIKLSSPVGVSGRRIRQPGSNNKITRPKPSQSCQSCSDDQHSFTSEDREKSLNSCFTDHDSSNPFSGHHHPQHPQQSSGGNPHQQYQNSSSQHHDGNHADRDLDSPDQDYDFNSRFSPPPTDNSYHSENHCQCYGDDDDTDSEADFIGSGLESSGRTVAGTRRSSNQYRANQRRSRGGHHRRHCSMDQEEEEEGVDDEGLVTKDTVCIIESETGGSSGRGIPNSARELHAKTLNASKGRKAAMTTTPSATMVGLSAAPSSKSYHNICGEVVVGGRSYELAKSGQSANFGAHSGSRSAACGKLFDKVCINNSCSGCTGGGVNGGYKRSPGAPGGGGMLVEGVVGGSGVNNNRNNRKSNETSGSAGDGINEFMHGFAGAATPSGSSTAAVAAAMQLAASYGPQVIN